MSEAIYAFREKMRPKRRSVAEVKAALRRLDEQLDLPAIGDAIDRRDGKQIVQAVLGATPFQMVHVAVSLTFLAYISNRLNRRVK